MVLDGIRKFACFLYGKSPCTVTSDKYVTYLSLVTVHGDFPYRKQANFRIPSNIICVCKCTGYKMKPKN